MEDDGLSRRDMLVGVGTTLAAVSGAGCSGSPEIQGPTPTATPIDVGFELQTTETPQTWEPLDEFLRFDFDSPRQIETVDVEIVDTAGNSTATTVTDFGGDTVAFEEEFVPTTAGTYTLTVTATHGDRTETWSGREVTVDWKTPEDVLFGDQLRKLLETIDNDAQFMDSLATDTGYTEQGRVVATFFIELMNTDEELAKALAPTLSGYDQQVTESDVALLTAVPDSTDQYRKRFTKFGLSESDEFGSIREFETQLYGLQEILGGRTTFREDENASFLRTALLTDFRSMRDNILSEKGYFEKRDIQYLGTVADLIAERKIAANPRYEQLREQDNWVTPTADGKISQEAVDTLVTVKESWNANSANDLIRDPIKRYALNVDTEKDVVLLEVGYTDAVDYSRRKRLITDVIDYMAAEYDIYIIAVEGNKDKETFSSASDWISKTDERASELEKFGMHLLYFDDVALKDAAGKARVGRGVSRGVVETEHREGYVDYALKHEMGHMFGLWSEKYGWVHAGCNSEQYDSYMTYCSDLPAEKFTEKDLNAMREQQFEQDNMSMSRLETLVIEGRSFYDEFEEIYTPASLQVTESR